MTKLQEIRRKLLDNKEQRRTMLATLEMEHRDFAGAEAAEYAALSREQSELERAELEAVELEESRARMVPVQVARADGTGLPVELPRGVERFSPSVGAVRIRGMDWAERLFGAVQQPSPFKGDHYESFARFAMSIASGRHDDRLMATAGNEYEGTGGGFFTTDDHRIGLLGALYEESIPLQYADVQRVNGPALTIADVDRSSGAAGADFGALSATYWPDGPAPADISVSQMKTVQLTLVPKNCVCAAQVSNNLLDDAPAFGEALMTNLGKEGQRVADAAFYQGTGVGMPRGILKDPALITITKESGQLAATIQIENLMNAYARLHPGSQRRAMWVANPSTVPQLMQLQIALGVAGVSYPAMREESGQFYIFGLPVKFTEMLPTLGSLGDIILVDWSQYLIGMRRDIQVDSSPHPGFMKNLMTYRMLFRVDGMGKWPKPYTPRNGSTLSWCVAIAAR